MAKRERLEITFGEKDADLWQYIESFGLPKAALVKKMIREHKNQQFTLQAPIEQVKTHKEITADILVSGEQLKEDTPKKNSPFSNLAAKK